MVTSVRTGGPPPPTWHRSTYLGGNLCNVFWLARLEAGHGHPDELWCASGNEDVLRAQELSALAEADCVEAVCKLWHRSELRTHRRHLVVNVAEEARQLF